MAWIVIAFFVFMMFKTFQQPFIGLIFMWFAIWLYPNSLLYGTLSLNIRLDDLFVVFTFLVSLYKKPKYISLWTSNMYRLAILWWMVHVIGNFNGLLYNNWQSTEEVFKFLLKAAYVPMTVAILVIQLKDYDHIISLSKWMLIAGTFAACLGMATVLFPETFALFLIPDSATLSNKSVLENLEEQVELARRARGSVGIVSTSIICLFFSLLSLNLLINKPSWLFPKKVVAVLFVLSFLGLVFTQSRGPMIAFGVAGIYMLFKARNFKILVPSIAVVALLLLVENPIRDLIFNRFVGNTGSTLDSGVSIRSNIWKMFLENYDPVLLVNGMGMVSAYKAYNATAHNTYLGSLIYGGIWGFLLMFVLMIKSLRYSSLLKKRSSIYAHFWGGFAGILILFMMIIGFSIEDFQQTICMQLFFSVLLICEKIVVWETVKKEVVPTPQLTLSTYQ